MSEHWKGTSHEEKGRWGAEKRSLTFSGRIGKRRSRASVSEGGWREMEGWRQIEKQEGWQRRMGTQREGWKRRMGEGWKKGWKEECDRWVVPGQSWEGAERLASQGERTHTHTHKIAHIRPVRQLTRLMYILCCQECFRCLPVCQENVDHMTNRQIDGAADMFWHTVCTNLFSALAINLCVGRVR